MFRMCASNSHSYTHLILALGIVRKPTVWVFITSNTLAHMTLACLLVLASSWTQPRTHACPTCIPGVQCSKGKLGQSNCQTCTHRKVFEMLRAGA